MPKLSPFVAAAVTAAMPALAENRIDQIRPDAPALAAYGDLPVGVTTRTFTMVDQIDVAATPASGEIARADRTLTVEIWYPAAPQTAPGGRYEAIIRDGETTVTLTGQAVRDADADDALRKLTQVARLQRESE